MKALVLTSLSGPDALSVQNVPDPTPKPDQTLVQVAAGGMNFADLMTTRGGYPGTPQPPLIVGREFAGVEIKEDGSQGQDAKPRRVMGYAQWAAFAEKTAAYPNLLWPTPDNWTDEQAAAFPVNYFTAYLAYWQAGMTPAHPSQPTWGQPPSLPRAKPKGLSGGAKLRPALSASSSTPLPEALAPPPCKSENSSASKCTEPPPPTKNSPA